MAKLHIKGYTAGDVTTKTRKELIQEKKLIEKHIKRIEEQIRLLETQERVHSQELANYYRSSGIKLEPKK